jgi:hypothetical protein
VLEGVSFVDLVDFVVPEERSREAELLLFSAFVSVVAFFVVVVAVVESPLLVVELEVVAFASLLKKLGAILVLLSLPPIEH